MEGEAAGAPAGDAPRPARPWLRRLVLVLAGTAFAVVAGELALRVALPAPTYIEGPYNARGRQLRQTTYERVDDPKVAFRLRPLSRMTMIYPGFGDVPERRVEYRINQHGFRDYPYEQPKPAGTFRIAVLGDSFTHGNGLDLEETFPKVMEAWFEGQGADHVEVMNCGVSAYNTHQQVDLLRERVLAFEPDVVLIAYYLNDVMAPYGTDERKGSEGSKSWETRLLRWLGPDPARVATRIEELPELALQQHLVLTASRRSRLFGLTLGALRDLLDERQMTKTWDGLYAPDSAGWQRMERALGSALELSEEHGFALRLTIFPNPARFAPYPYTAYEDRVRALCSELELPVIEVHSAVSQRDPAQLIAHPRDRHGSALCNRLIGERLAEELAQQFAEPIDARTR